MDDARRARIAGLCSVGDVLAAQKDLPAALLKFREALALIPRPVELHDEAVRVLTAIGDACFHLGLFSESRHALHGAMRSAGGRGVPFLHMRLGQCELELGNLDRAADEFARAYEAGGRELVEGIAPKYLEFVRTLNLP
ncbi:tetratricopeptide repeat protein [Archangium lipolyticum]|uniref:tetratricopeptide repeat protein n=1 Tax=Archangium lipolyticum TaxID=2970465 RepID=UPI00214A16D0|nr:tetratricopeptide repeat protein [Archangium lipolyticum]